MDGRDAFLTLARDKHYEFSSLRRAQFSTLCMLYELHNQGQDKFVYTCNNCKNHVETRYHCTVCDVSLSFSSCLQHLMDLNSSCLTFRTLIYVFRVKRKSVTFTKWNVSVSILTTALHQPMDGRNRTHKKLANSQYSDAFNLWFTLVNVAMQTVVFLRVRR